MDPRHALPRALRVGVAVAVGVGALVAGGRLAASSAGEPSTLVASVAEFADNNALLTFRGPSIKPVRLVVLASPARRLVGVSQTVDARRWRCTFIFISPDALRGETTTLDTLDVLAIAKGISIGGRNFDAGTTAILRYDDGFSNPVRLTDSVRVAMPQAQRAALGRLLPP